MATQGAALTAAHFGKADGPRGLTGRLRSKSQAKRGGLTADLIVEMYAYTCGRFYGFGEAPKTAFDWYSLRFFMSEKAMRASLRPMMTRA